MRISDWSSDVCSSDLGAADGFRVIDHHHPQAPEAAGATVVLRHLQTPLAQRFVNAGAAANRLISQSAATLSSIGGAPTKLNVPQSATDRKSTRLHSSH